MHSAGWSGIGLFYLNIEGAAQGGDTVISPELHNWYNELYVNINLKHSQSISTRAVNEVARGGAAHPQQYEEAQGSTDGLRRSEKAKSSRAKDERYGSIRPASSIAYDTATNAIAPLPYAAHPLSPAEISYKLDEAETDAPGAKTGEKAQRGRGRKPKGEVSSGLRRNIGIDDEIKQAGAERHGTVKEEHPRSVTEGGASKAQDSGITETLHETLSGVRPDRRYGTIQPVYLQGDYANLLMSPASMMHRLENMGLFTREPEITEIIRREQLMQRGSVHQRGAEKYGNAGQLRAGAEISTGTGQSGDIRQSDGEPIAESRMQEDEDTAIGRYGAIRPVVPARNPFGILADIHAEELSHRAGEPWFQSGEYTAGNAKLSGSGSIENRTGGYIPVVMSDRQQAMSPEPRDRGKSGIAESKKDRSAKIGSENAKSAKTGSGKAKIAEAVSENVKSGKTKSGGHTPIPANRENILSPEGGEQQPGRRYGSIQPVFISKEYPGSLTTVPHAQIMYLHDSPETVQLSETEKADIGAKQSGESRYSAAEQFRITRDMRRVLGEAKTRAGNIAETTDAGIAPAALQYIESEGMPGRSAGLPQASAGKEPVPEAMMQHIAPDTSAGPLERKQLQSRPRFGHIKKARLGGRSGIVNAAGSKGTQGTLSIPSMSARPDAFGSLFYKSADSGSEASEGPQFDTARVERMVQAAIDKAKPAEHKASIKTKAVDMTIRKPPSPAAGDPLADPVQMNRLVNQVYEQLERKMFIERRRMGL